MRREMIIIIIEMNMKKKVWSDEVLKRLVQYDSNEMKYSIEEKLTYYDICEREGEEIIILWYWRRMI